MTFHSFQKKWVKKNVYEFDYITDGICNWNFQESEYSWVPQIPMEVTKLANDFFQNSTFILKKYDKYVSAWSEPVSYFYKLLTVCLNDAAYGRLNV